MAGKKVAAKNVVTTRTTVTKFTAGVQPAKLATLTSWSYSVYTDYMRCPLMVCFNKIKRIKMPEEANPAFVKGNMVHQNAEGVILGKIKKIIPELKAVATRIEEHRKMKSLVEPDWSFTKAWLPTTYDDWSNCWLRIKVDAVGIIRPKPKSKAPTLIQITDWKTGKVSDDHRQQRSLYALGALQLVELEKLPGVVGKDVELTAEHLYTDTTQSATETFTMKDLKPLKREWEARVKQMMSDTVYRASPGFHCRWCKFRKSAGGPCPENQ